jgi:hypothetical protein
MTTTGDDDDDEDDDDGDDGDDDDDDDNEKRRRQRTTTTTMNDGRGECVSGSEQRFVIAPGEAPSAGGGGAGGGGAPCCRSCAVCSTSASASGEQLNMDCAGSCIDLDRVWAVSLDVGDSRASTHTWVDFRAYLPDARGIMCLLLWAARFVLGHSIHT